MTIISPFVIFTDCFRNGGYLKAIAPVTKEVIEIFAEAKHHLLYAIKIPDIGVLTDSANGHLLGLFRIQDFETGANIREPWKTHSGGFEAWKNPIF
jgi:hypothetical protein